MVAEPSSKTPDARRRRWLVAAGVFVAVVAVVLVAYAAGAFRSSGADPDAGGSKEPGAPVASTSTGSPSAGAGPVGATPPGIPGEADSEVSGWDRSGGSSTDKADGAPAGAPLAPAEDGAPLKQLSGPPAHTLGALKASSGRAGESYLITFRPFGYGPRRGENPTVVALVSASTPQGEIDDPLDLRGRNLLIELATPPTVDLEGGAYRSVARLATSGDLLVFVIANLTRVSE